jgi:hypothetical protein
LTIHCVLLVQLGLTRLILTLLLLSRGFLGIATVLASALDRIVGLLLQRLLFSIFTACFGVFAARFSVLSTFGRLGVLARLGVL